MQDYFNVSGIDRNEGAGIVFVMCRSAASEGGYVQVGSGHIVGANGGFVPPGVQAGQYSVTFQLPHGCAPNSIVVRDDKNDKVFLKDVKVIPCEVSSGVGFGQNTNRAAWQRT